MFAELSSIIESDGLAGACGQGFDHEAEIIGDRLRGSRLLPQQQRAPRSAFLGHPQELSWLAEAHEVGFPIAGTGSGFALPPGDGEWKPYPGWMLSTIGHWADAFRDGTFGEAASDAESR